MDFNFFRKFCNFLHIANAYTLIFLFFFSSFFFSPPKFNVSTTQTQFDFDKIAVVSFYVADSMPLLCSYYFFKQKNGFSVYFQYVDHCVTFRCHLVLSFSSSRRVQCRKSADSLCLSELPERIQQPFMESGRMHGCGKYVVCSCID